MPLLVVFLYLWTRFFDFYLDNRTIISPATDSYWWGGSYWDVFQGVGAIATAGALGFIIYQTISLSRQTKLFEKEMDYRLRPWFFPTDIGKLHIKKWNEESKKGLDVILYLYFKNEGSLPVKSFNATVKFRTMLNSILSYVSSYD
jgi:hypothetical protein